MLVACLARCLTVDTAFRRKGAPNRRPHDGLWHFAELPCHGDQGRPPSPRLGTCHVVAALHEFGLLEDLLPSA